MKKRTRNVVASILYVGREMKAVDERITERVFGYGSGFVSLSVVGIRGNVIRIRPGHVLTVTIKHTGTAVVLTKK